MSKSSHPLGPVLGIETSCDDTGVAIYDPQKGLLSHALYSQIALHRQFGGVVPELASRDHIQKLLPLTRQVLNKAGLSSSDLGAIAYTRGPGLMGALLVGAMLGRSLAFSLGLPAVGVHHMEAHILAVMLEKVVPSFPFLALVVSGGHTLLVKARGLGNYCVLGESVDDAVGEAFDKTAKLLGLGYPGGAALANLAEQGDPERFDFPRPMVSQPGLNFSFSGLKTFVSHLIHAHTEADYADIARGFEEAVVDTLSIKCKRALMQTGLKQLVIAGGVGANKRLRARLRALGEQLNTSVFYPQTQFCTDNGAMVAYTGCQYRMKGYEDDLSVEVRPRWPLGDLTIDG